MSERPFSPSTEQEECRWAAKPCGIEASPAESPDILRRFSEGDRARRYRDRFRKGRRRRTHEREADALERLLVMLGPVDVLLDAPSGAGRFAPTLLRHTRQLIQVDASIHMLELGRDDHPVCPERGACLLADVRRLPLMDESVDLVFCHRLLNHIPEPRMHREIVAELARVARRFLILSSLTPPWLIRVVRQSYRRLAHQPCTNPYVTEQHLRSVAEVLGLRAGPVMPIRASFRSAAFLTFEKR